jgi:hypothetical protein
MLLVHCGLLLRRAALALRLIFGGSAHPLSLLLLLLLLQCHAPTTAPPSSSPQPACTAAWPPPCVDLTQ